MTQPLDLDAIQARADAATPGPWRISDDDTTWRLHGTHTRIPGMKWQILKAPKTGTPYAEYWPNQADGEFIAAARTDVPAMLAEIRRLRTELAGMTDLKDRALTKQDSLRDELTREERAHGQTIDERDRATAMADRLAAALAPADVIGEHSGMNDPWQNALDYASEQPSA